MADKKLNLLEDFPIVSKETWLAKVKVDLKGKDFDKKLVWKTHEGFKVQPCYRSEDIADFATLNSAPGKFPYVRGTKQDNLWFVRQNICVQDPKAANVKALDILNKGIDSLGFVLEDKFINEASIKALLNNIAADCVEINFMTSSEKVASLASIVIAYYKANKLDLKGLKGSFSVDPIEKVLTTGEAQDRKVMLELLKSSIEAAKELPNYRVVNVDAYRLNNAGCYCSQELGYALSWGNQYMEMMTEAGVSADDAAAAIKFNLGVGTNYFMEIAKIRAARVLWAKIAKAYGCSEENAKMHLCAQTSLFNKTVYDAHVNLLRTQTEAMSAALAGVDSMLVLPFDVTYGQPSDFSERIARNQQLLLKEESHFDKVTDPGAGSYYIETLTKDLAEQAWKLFLELQEKDGFYACVLNNTVQNVIDDNLEARLKGVAQRQEVFLGSNDFPNFSEISKDKINESISSHTFVKPADDSKIKVLPTMRATEEFEQVRLAVERSSHRPKAFMLTIGNLNMRLARAQYSCNYLATAGYEVIDNLGFDTVEAGLEAARKAGADMVVLCSSDDEYLEFAPQAQKLIDKEILIVAGAPACMDDLKAQGIKYFIHVRTNVLETLKTLNNELLK